MRDKKVIECPECGKQDDVSLHLETVSNIRIPVKKGLPNPSDELLLDKKLYKSQIIAGYSSTESDTRITVYNEGKVMLYCKKCQKFIELKPFQYQKPLIGGEQ